MGMGMVMRMHVCVEDAWEGANPAPPWHVRHTSAFALFSSSPPDGHELPCMLRCKSRGN